MRIDQHFQNVDNRPKVKNIEKDAAIAEFIETVGITDLDAEGAPKRKIPRTDYELRALEGERKKAADKKAKSEYREALANLDNGTAIHRQPNDRTQPARIVKKVKAVKPKVTKRKAKAKKYVKPTLAKSFKQLRTAALNSRLKRMLKTLKAGESIKMISSIESAGPSALYCLQRKDIVRLSDRTHESVIRIKNINEDVSYFLFDRYKRYNTESLIDMHEPKAILRALMSGDLVRADSIEQKTVYVSKHIVNLAKQHGFNIFAVYKVKHLVGWILLEETKSAEQLAEEKRIHEVGDLLIGLDYKKCQAAVAERMPGASAAELADAAFAEYKAVYLNGQ